MDCLRACFNVSLRALRTALEMLRDSALGMGWPAGRTESRERDRSLKAGRTVWKDMPPDRIGEP